MPNIAQETPDRCVGTATSTLPDGMTREEADRLIAEAANRTKDDPR